LSRWQRFKALLNRYLPSKGIEIRFLDLHKGRVIPEKELEHLNLKTVVIDSDTRVVGKKGNSPAVTHSEHWIECVQNQNPIKFGEYLKTWLLKQEGKDTFYILISKPEATP